MTKEHISLPRLRGAASRPLYRLACVMAIVLLLSMPEWLYGAPLAPVLGIFTAGQRTLSTDLITC